MYKPLIFLILIVFTPFLICPFNQARSVRDNLIIKSSVKATNDLVKEVEALYKKKVVIEDTNADYIGKSDVLEDGTPHISINTTSPNKETTLAHELFHLILRIKGFSTIYNGQSSIEISESSLKNINFALEVIRDMVLHSIFFPKIEALGIHVNPNSEYIFKEYEIPNLITAQSINRLTGPLIVMRLLVECSNVTIKDQIKAIFISKGGDEEFRKGVELFNILTSEGEKTPDWAARITIQCLNLLFKGQATFSIIDWDEIKKGAHFADRVCRYWIHLDNYAN